jgi:hypothetical protein
MGVLRREVTIELKATQLPEVNEGAVIQQGDGVVQAAVLREAYLVVPTADWMDDIIQEFEESNPITDYAEWRVEPLHLSAETSGKHEALHRSKDTKTQAIPKRFELKMNWQEIKQRAGEIANGITELWSDRKAAGGELPELVNVWERTLQTIKETSDWWGKLNSGQRRMVVIGGLTAAAEVVTACSGTTPTVKPPEVQASQPTATEIYTQEEEATPTPTLTPTEIPTQTPEPTATPTETPSVPADVQNQVEQYFGETGTLLTQTDGTLAIVGIDGTILAQETERGWEVAENAQVIASQLEIELNPERQYSTLEATTSNGTYNYLIDGFNGAKLARQEGNEWVRVPEGNVAEMYGHLLPETPKLAYEGKFGYINSNEWGDPYHQRDGSYLGYWIQPIMTGNWRAENVEVPELGTVTEVALEGIFVDLNSNRVVKLWFGLGVPEVEKLWWGFSFNPEFNPSFEVFEGSIAEATGLLAHPGIQIETFFYFDRPASGWMPNLNPSAEKCSQLGMTHCWHPHNVFHFMVLEQEAQLKQLMAEIRSAEGITSDFSDLIIPPYQIYAPEEVLRAWHDGGW